MISYIFCMVLTISGPTAYKKVKTTNSGERYLNWCWVFTHHQHVIVQSASNPSFHVNLYSKHTCLMQTAFFAWSRCELAPKRKNTHSCRCRSSTSSRHDALLQVTWISLLARTASRKEATVPRIPCNHISADYLRCLLVTSGDCWTHTDLEHGTNNEFYNVMWSCDVCKPVMKSPYQAFISGHKCQQSYDCQSSWHQMEASERWAAEKCFFQKWWNQYWEAINFLFVNQIETELAIPM